MKTLRNPYAPLAAVAFAVCLPALAQAEPNAQMTEVLSTYGKLSPVPIEKTTPAIAKAAPTLATAVEIVMKKDGKPMPPFTGTTQDFTIDVGDGNKVDARAYIPAGEGPFPTVLYIHGGGWVIGSLKSYDASPRALCEAVKATVISTDYRQAPDNKFPTAHDDTQSVYRWVLANAAQYKGDPKKVAVAGESVGGNMAAEICVYAKEKGLQMPVHQLLVYPVTGYDFETKSYKDNETTKPLSAAGMRWFYGYYLNKPEEGNDPRVNLFQVKDVSGLPPATIIAAEIDPLLTEGKAFADKLQAAGVKVQYKAFDGVTHEFYGMGAVIDEAKQAEDFAAEQLKAAFGK